MSWKYFSVFFIVLSFYRNVSGYIVLEENKINDVLDGHIGNEKVFDRNDELALLKLLQRSKLEDMLSEDEDQEQLGNDSNMLPTSKRVVCNRNGCFRSGK